MCSRRRSRQMTIWTCRCSGFRRYWRKRAPPLPARISPAPLRSTIWSWSTNTPSPSRTSSWAFCRRSAACSITLISKIPWAVRSDRRSGASPARASRRRRCAMWKWMAASTTTRRAFRAKSFWRQWSRRRSSSRISGGCWRAGFRLSQPAPGSSAASAASLAGMRRAFRGARRADG